MKRVGTRTASWACALLVAGGSMVAGCSQPLPEAPRGIATPAALERTPATDVSRATGATGGAATGGPAVTLSPPPVTTHPATVSGLAPVATDDVPPIVILEPHVQYAYPTPSERPMMDQVATRFTPSAMIARTGMPAEFRNDDDKLHNVRVRERGRAADDLLFNVALSQGVTYDVTFPKDAAWDVRCDMHQNMYGLVVSTSSPYAAIADADGTFRIDGVVPGAFTLIAYTSRERLERAIDVREGQHLTLTLR